MSAFVPPNTQLRIVAGETQFHIKPQGQHRFTYAKVEHQTGENIWRWPA